MLLLTHLPKSAFY